MPRPRADKGARVDDVNTRFDISACDNAELVPLLLDIPLEYGHPWTASLFVWAMVDRRFRDAVYQRLGQLVDDQIKPKCRLWLDAVLELKGIPFNARRSVGGPLENWNPCSYTQEGAPPLARSIVALDGTPLPAGESPHQADQRMTLRLWAETENRKTELVNLMLKIVSLREARVLLHLLVRDAPKEGALQYKMLAHVSQGLCMACSGVNQRCLIRPTGQYVSNSTVDDFWMSPGTFSDGYLYAKKRCCEWQTVLIVGGVDPLGYVRQLKHRTQAPEERQMFTAVWAKAMLHQKDIYEIGTSASIEALFIDIAAAFALDAPTHRLMLAKNHHVAATHTLQCRLDLTAAQLAASIEERDAVLRMKVQEDRALKAQRVAKFRDDIDCYIRRVAPGESIASLTPSFPSLDASLTRLIVNCDENGRCTERHYGRYVDATEFTVLRRFVNCVLETCTRLVPLDVAIMGEEHAHSSEAVEYVMNLTTGSFAGDGGMWRDFLEIVPDLPSPRASNGDWCFMYYTIAAMHVFDNLGSQWQMTLVEEPSAGWQLSNGFMIGFMPLRDIRFDFIKQWHTMVRACFEARAKETDLVLPRAHPSAKTWNTAMAATAAQEGEPRRTRREQHAIDECFTYLRETCGVCFLFASTRHAGLLTSLVTPVDIVKCLVDMHVDWKDKKGRAHGPAWPSWAPDTAKDFALHVTDNVMVKKVDYVNGWSPGERKKKVSERHAWCQVQLPHGLPRGLPCLPKTSQPACGPSNF